MQPPADHPPIAGRYTVDPTKPLPGAGGGLTAFVASDLRTGRRDLMAVSVDRAAPARANVLRDLNDGVDNLLVPLAAGAGPGPNNAPAYYIVCPAPPGPALGLVGKPWPEAALVAQVLRPAAMVLRHLEARRLTHRGIRPDNIFQSASGQPIAFGCAWAAPPALHQPPAYEPFYSLMCHKSARGDGSIADDVYALGCLLIALATGTAPMTGLDDATVLRRKLELGSYAAIAGDARLPPMIADLARGMLAEDPDHRPSPSMLLDPASARGRRVAARPPRRAPRPLTVGGTTAWDARTLAYAIGKEPENGVRAMRDGSVGNWLRRGLGDATLCARTDDLVRQRAAEPQQDEALADTMLAMRIVAILEPLAPLYWRGAALWPDGIGPALAAASQGDSVLLERLIEAIAVEAPGTWATLREDRCDVFALRTASRANQSLLRIRPPAGGVARLVYTLNPLLPCGGAIGIGNWVTNLDAVAPAMEAVMQGGGQPFDADIVSFLAARVSRDLEMEVNALAAHHGPNFPAMPWLRILGQLQARFSPHPMISLANWIVEQSEPAIAAWQNRDRRAALREKLRHLAAEGHFRPIVATLDDPAGLEQDAASAAAASDALAKIDADLVLIAQGGPERAGQAARYGQEMTAVLGLTALALAVLSMALG